MINEKLLSIQICIYENGQCGINSTLINKNLKDIPSYIFELKYHLEKEIAETFTRVIAETISKDYFIGSDI